MPSLNKTGVYLRVSDKDQNLDGQKAEVTAWITAHGMQPENCRWYIDKQTGKTLNRKAMTQLRADIDAGKVTTVVCQRLDRLSRNLVDGLTLVCNWAERGIRLVAVTQDIDLSGAIGKIVAAVILGVAEMELQLRRERQRAGIEVARERGVYKGRKKGTYRGDPNRARELYTLGMKIPEIAKAMGVSESSIWKYLKMTKPVEAATCSS